jgi:UDP-3-O-[3-hydroxymyristoyl] glucosamine N-acyltransferase
MNRSLSELAELCRATLEGEGDRCVSGPAGLAEAGPEHVSFLANPKYADQLNATRAGAVIVARDQMVEREDLNLLRCDRPNAAFTAVVEAFAAGHPRPDYGRSAAAWVDPSAELGEGVQLAPGSFVGAGARIGARTVLHPGAVVGPECTVGEDCELHSCAVLYPRVVLGDRCLLHAGAVVGADGFGFEPTPAGWIKVPQCGTVELGDDVELGAQSCVDRGRFGATRIGSGTKIDNLVHVAHNVQIGANVVLAAQAGISGSSTLEDWVVLGGQTGVAGHTRLAAGVRMAGGSGAFGDLTEPGDYSGTPARPHRENLKRLAAPARLERMERRLRALERRLAGESPGDAR